MAQFQAMSEMLETKRTSEMVIHNLRELSRAVDAALAGEFAQQLARAADLIAERLLAGGKVMTCGNGGSATDAAHLAEELLGRFQCNRRPLPAVCLSSDGPALTCIANDFGFEEVFARQVQALGRPGDVLVGFTTSGKSENVNRALEAAKRAGVTTIALTGEHGGRSGELADLVVAVPSASGARVQELHTLVIHCICGECERRCSEQ
jgi:D-sedoheptulose 7-phosphate isomerase